ncbi:MAG: ABC transporter ATP-binding protein/permease [Firmicutes bacterium]|nr:ABC transporter ATP-binding protein/permease [Bacillota bacterium]
MTNAKNKSGFARFFFSLYRPIRGLVILFFVASIIFHAGILIRNFIIRDIIDMPLQDGFQIRDLYIAIGIIIGIKILEVGFDFISNASVKIWAYRRQQPFITRKIFSDLNKKSYTFFTDNHSGKIASSVTAVGENVYQLNSDMFNNNFRDIATFATSLIMLFAINFWIGLVAGLYFVVYVVAFCFYLRKKHVKLIRQVAVKYREHTGYLNDAVLNFTSLRTYNSVGRFSDKLSKKRGEGIALQTRAHSNKWWFYIPTSFTTIVLFGFAMWFSVTQFDAGIMTIGSLVFVATSILTLQGSSIQIGWGYSGIAEKMVKLRDCYDLLYDDNNLACIQTEKLVVEKPTIEFKNVTFKYTTKNVFENLNLEINAGQKVGIIGVSGSGKTTFVNLLFRFYQPQKGEILIDGKNIANYSGESLYDNICFVPQETILLHDTIMENIRIAKPNATEEEIICATKRAELHGFVDSLENKYQTIVGERGIKLSGGQRQRIALARIFLRSAKIIVFDEATSSLDNDTEFKVQDNINKYFDTQTIICIAHRLTTLKEMGKIIVLKEGRIIETGTALEILKKY